ncbi:MAG: sulfatase-like hydrolase/transferase [Caldilineaceae bacterium]
MAQQRPNILFICTDQQRYDSLGCYGNEYVQTPTIDRLAAEGVLFERCYVQNPVCGPSRQPGDGPLRPQSWAVRQRPSPCPSTSRCWARPSTMAATTAVWWARCTWPPATADAPKRRDDGFSFYQWAHDPSHGSPENQYHRWLKTHHPDLYAAASSQGLGRAGHDPVGFDTMPTEAHYSHWVGDQSVEFLENARDPEKPFFLWVNFYDPHHPFVAP